MKILRKLILAALSLSSALACAQGVRYDIPPILGPTGQPLPNIAVSLCAGTGTISGATCSPQVQSFSDITLNVPCVLGNPVTLTASTQCQSTSDAFGNAGFWLSPNTYIYCLTGRGVAGACYNLTLPAGATPSGTLRSGPIIASGPVTVPDGSVIAPGLRFTSNNSGLFNIGGSTIVSVNGTQGPFFNNNVNLSSNSSCYTFGNSQDTSVGRSAAGQVTIGNGTCGDISGTVRANQAQLGGATGGNPLEIGGGSSMVHQIGTGAGNGQVWTYSLQNAGNSDLYQFGASSSTYTTAGVVGWLGNSNAFIYHSSQNFLIGAGLGTNNAVNFDSTGNTLRFPSAGVLGFTSGGPSAANDTGLSRSAAGTLAVGNGTSGDTSGTLKASIAQLADGSVSAPSYSFLNETGTGLFRLGPQNLGFTFAGVGAFQLFNAGIANAPASVYSWVSSFNGPRDTGLSRLSAGVIGVGNGLAGDITGTLKANTVNAVSGFQVNGTALAASNLSNGVTGSGAVVLASSPTVTTPSLASPAFTGTASGNATIPPTMLNSTTGSGAAVLATSPSLTTPNIGAATGTTHTFATQAAPANPPAGDIIIYGDSGTGNLTCRNSSGGSCLVLPFKAYVEAAGCNGTTALPSWDLPASSAPNPNCNTGTNIQEGTLDFADGQSAQFKVPLAADWSGAIDVRLFFFDASTSGTVIFQIATACSSTGGSATDDVAFNTAQSFPTITLSTPASAQWTTALTSITTTGCSAGNMLQVKISRATDTATSVARVKGAELTIRRAM